MNTQHDRDAILKLLAGEPDRTWRPAEIVAALHFRGKQIKQLQGLLRQMVLDGVIVELRPGVYGLGQAADLVTGRLRIVRSGAGYVTDPARIEAAHIALLEALAASRATGR